MNYEKNFEENKKYLKDKCGMNYLQIHKTLNINIQEDTDKFIVVIDDKDKFEFLKYEQFDYNSFLQNKDLKLEMPIAMSTFFVFNTILREESKCGFPNKVYVSVSSEKEWEAFLYICNIQQILSKGKIVFIIEGQNVERDCKDETIVEERHLHFSELEDLVFLYQPQSCGYEFVRDILKENDFIVYADGWTLHRELEKIEKKLGHDYFKKVFLNKNLKISGVKFLQELLKYQKILLQSGFDSSSILNIFCDEFLMEQELTVSDIFKSLLLCKYIAEHPKKNNRIKPVIVYFPDHYQRFMDYYLNIQCAFERVLYFRTVRNPVIRSIRAYEYIKKNNLYYFVNYLDVLFEELTFDQFSVRQGHSYAMKFEDLKQNPEDMTKKLCMLFGIPFQSKMLENHDVFSLKAVNPPLDEAFQADDIKMLGILYQEILLHYQYKDTVDEENDIVNYQFQFEKELSDILDVDGELLRIEIKRRIQEYLRHKNVEFPCWIQ